MQINFNQLIHNYNQEQGKTKGLSPNSECLTKADLAREMVDQGILKSFKSALNMIHYHQNGVAKSADYQMLQFLMQKFSKPIEQILTT
jgi:hypothetical protein